MYFPELFRDDVFLLETQRLWLRWPRAADARALHRFAALKEVAEMTATWPHPLPNGVAETRILRARQANTGGAALILGLMRKNEPNRLIGMIGGPAESAFEQSIGLMLDPEFCNRGLMTEALLAFTAGVFRYSAISRIRGESFAGNLASRRVFEKAGFCHTGDGVIDAPARGDAMPCLEFVLDKAQWRATSPPVVQGQAA